MEPDNPNNLIAFQYYIKEQKNSISKLNDLLNSSILSGYAKRGVSLFIEVILFLLFISILLVVLYIPLDPIQLNKSIAPGQSVHAVYHNAAITDVVLFLKAVLFVGALMPLFLMLLLLRNRKKSEMIHTAFLEV